MDLFAVRSAVADSVGSVTPALNAHGYVPSSVSVPCFYVGGIEVDYDQTMGRGSDDITLICLVLVSPTSDESGQQQLDNYLKGSGASSIKAAIEADSTLGGVCDSVEVQRAQNYGLHRVSGVDLLGAELVLNVVGSGSS